MSVYTGGVGTGQLASTPTRIAPSVTPPPTSRPFCSSSIRSVLADIHERCDAHIGHCLRLQHHSGDAHHGCRLCLQRQPGDALSVDESVLEELPAAAPTVSNNITNSAQFSERRPV